MVTLGMPPPRPELAAAELSSPPVAMLASRWISTVEEWIDTTARRGRSAGRRPRRCASRRGGWREIFRRVRKSVKYNRDE